MAMMVTIRDLARSAFYMSLGAFTPVVVFNYDPSFSTGLAIGAWFLVISSATSDGLS